MKLSIDDLRILLVMKLWYVYKKDYRVVALPNLKEIKIAASQAILPG